MTATVRERLIGISNGVHSNFGGNYCCVQTQLKVAWALPVVIVTLDSDDLNNF